VRLERNNFLFLMTHINDVEIAVVVACGQEILIV
jgi:hypothetical protein